LAPAKEPWGAFPITRAIGRGIGGIFRGGGRIPFIGDIALLGSTGIGGYAGGKYGLSEYKGRTEAMRKHPLIGSILQSAYGGGLLGGWKAGGFLKGARELPVYKRSPALAFAIAAAKTALERRAARKRLEEKLLRRAAARGYLEPEVT
jgi:hypothetical protein